VPTANLEERIKEELEENPALEVDEEKPEEYEESKEEFKRAEEQYDEPDGSNDEYENIDISEYVREGDDDIADYKLRDDNYPDADEDRVIPHKVETSFYEVLLDQLGLLNLDERQKKIAEQIVGSIDEDGYLRERPLP
jgi:DNA-directed RNA polymerase specialized sigma subunit, sigma54 homolog